MNEMSKMSSENGDADELVARRIAMFAVNAQRSGSGASGPGSGP